MYYMKLISSQKGITLSALIITVILLLILAGITLPALVGGNGIITKALMAKEKAEIAKEKEAIELALLEVKYFSEEGLTQGTLQSVLDKNEGKGKTRVTYDQNEEEFYVEFKESKRIYKVNKDKTVFYVVKEDELISQATIEATPERNVIPQLFHQVDVKATIPICIEESEYIIEYAWNTDKYKAPKDEKFIDSMATGTGKTRTATISTTDTEKGNYYLWIKMKVREKEQIQCFGPYAIKDHTTLIATNRESTDTSGFLGNTNVQRGLIKSVNIVTSLEGHSLNDSNCWDVTQGNNKGKYIAWYEEDNGYYNVTIAGDGGVVANSNSLNLFRNIGKNVKNQEVTITGLGNLDTALVTSMEAMFYGCSILGQLDVSNFNTSNVTNMQNMFSGCSSLGQLDVSNFNTSNVTNMRDMFSGCSSLIQLDLSNFNTSNVTSLFGTFQGCKSLKILNVSNWDTSKVTEMGEHYGYYSYGGMFQECSSLVKLDISEWDTSNVVAMGQMFNGCTNLIQINVGNQFDTSKVKSFYSMFNNCKSLRNINDILKKMDTSEALYLNNMFQLCPNVTQLDVSQFNTSNVTTMANMFFGCSSLGQLNLSNFNTSNVKNMQSMFYGCSSLEQLNLSNFNTGNVTNITNMFNGCSRLGQLNLSNFDTSNVTTMAFMFNGCSRLGQLNLSNFDTSNVTTMAFMFNGCSRLGQLDLSNFDTSNVNNMSWMFGGCSSLGQLNLSNFNTSNVTNMSSMFYIVQKTVEIITNSTTATWLQEKFPEYTNIKIN